MDVLFGVNGEGMGHAMRSGEMIKFLKKDYSVRVFAGGKAADYLKLFSNTSKIFYFRLISRDGRISKFKTFFYNLFTFPYFIYSFIRLFVRCLSDRPKVIISDFEPITAYLGLVLRIPVISFDNQHIVTDTDSLENVGRFQGIFYKFLVYLMCPFPKRKVITSFFFPRVLSYNATLVPPVIRKIVSKNKSRNGKNMLVYFSLENDSVLNLMEKLKIPFLFYGKTKKKGSKYMIIKDFSPHVFARDIAECRAVLSNAGMTSLGEAIYLKKPVLCFPLKNHLEQELNARYIEKEGFGKYCSNISKKRILYFIRKISIYRNNLMKFNFSNREVYAELKKAVNVYI